MNIRTSDGASHDGHSDLFGISVRGSLTYTTYSYGLNKRQIEINTNIPIKG